MKTGLFNALAEQELLESASFYDEQTRGLGLEYLDEVQKAINLIIRYPEIGSTIEDSVRRFIVPKFPYSLIYSVLEDNQIRILAVAHNKRKPKYWRNRS
ncbi:MAG: type II toxin-antitoxin system RelE/ParE family toxin [Calothrix sp. FI2-JRJ7]|jgi:plasmid stabilization system protein ParE|nr:type II toxin-antitoxin system RelE/ParE family toxin [Calothrix sp. FI2-JRJ7]